MPRTCIITGNGYRMQPMIPWHTMMCKPKSGLPLLFDRSKYRQRNIIERMSGWLEESQRIDTRYDKLALLPRWSRWLTRGAVYCSTSRAKPSQAAMD